jgi:radical SAM superfamily enzyme YgiQ (UPF0313 family)
VVKVALLVPPSPFLIEPLTFPPLGVLYLSAYLKTRGHEVVVYDYNDQRGRFDYKWNKIEKADFIGITGTTPQFKDMVKILDWNFKQHDYGKNKMFVAGGPHASSDPKSCLEAGFDSVVVGDGEYALQDIVEKKTHYIFSHPVGNLDNLPFPDWSAINIKRYHYKVDGSAAMSVITQRGCPYACAFCCHWEGYRKVRFRSPENVVEELEQLRNLYDYEAFMFWDDEFNLNRERTIKLCEALKPLEIKFRCFIRANLFDAEVAQAMKEAGCVEVGCGVESGSQRILNVIGKGTTVEQNTIARNICRMLGIRFKAFTIIGLPSEDEESVEETREWLRKNEPDDFDVTINTPLPGSPQWEHPEQYDIIFNKEAMRKALYQGTFYKGPPNSPVATSHLSAQRIVQLRDEIEDEFNRKVKSRDLWQDPPSL